MPMAQYDIRPYRTGDEVGLIETFNTVFGENDPDFRPRTSAEWDWAFAKNPAGRRIWVAEAEDGTIAAQCAALPYRVRIDGFDSSFTQGVDSMVHPDHRRGLRRPGLFVATAKPFFEEFTGPGKDILHYGWPVEPAWRIGKTFLDYQIIRTQTIHFAEPRPGARERPAAVEALDAFDPGVLALYERCEAEWGASLLRDERYLNWRFVENPRFDYHVFAVRRGAEWVGYAVYRGADWPMPGTGLVMDWLVPTDEPEVGELLRDAILAQARIERAHVVLSVFPDWSPWFQRWQDWGWRVHASDYLLIGIIQNPRYDTWWLRDRWWYQLAELDVV